jgi:hypothetical protein
VQAELKALRVNATTVRFHRQHDLEEVYVLDADPRHAVVGDAQKGTAPPLQKFSLKIEYYFIS